MRLFRKKRRNPKFTIWDDLKEHKCWMPPASTVRENTDSFSISLSPSLPFSFVQQYYSTQYLLQLTFISIVLTSNFVYLL